MATYIDREAVEKFIENGLNNPNEAERFGYDAVAIMGEVHCMDAANVAPVAQGQWLDVKKYNCGERVVATCSCCKERGELRTKMLTFGFWETNSPYCPSCGAKMDGGAK